MAKVLIIEDDIALSLSVKALLLQESYQVETTSSGEDGLQLLLFSKVDLLILDWNLPDMDGPSVCKALRDRGDPTRVLMLTGKTSIDDKECGFLCGADDYLTKPFDPRELLMRAKALLRRPEVVHEQRLDVAGVVLNLVDRSVIVEGTVIPFHKRDYDVLELLMRNAGTYFTTEELLARVWAASDESGNNAVRQAILRIRRQLGNRGDCIENRYGHGYRFGKPDTL